jgi:4-hydroxy-tetrahydrodipicolinate reductase
MSRIKVAIHGAAGRMGQRLVALGIADPDLQIVAALEAPLHPRIGQDAGTIAGVGEINVPLKAALDQPVDVVIDFSVPAGALAIAATCREQNIPLVVATTGLSDGQQEILHDAAKRIPLLWSPNMSLAVNLTMKLAEIAAEALAEHPSGADIEIIERHHRFKEDSPSGTALKFGKAIGDVMGLKSHRHGREGLVGKRPHGEIGYHAVRIGDNPGEHTIIFGLLGETLELTVRATSRDCYAHGALTAAKFLVGKPAGMYGMKDVLNL